MRLTEVTAPDAWKKEARKEFNAIVAKYGATSREKKVRNTDSDTLVFDRYISVLVSGENSLALHRDKRGRGLVMALAKWLVGQKAKGRQVSIRYWGIQGDPSGGQFEKDDLARAHQLLADISRVEPTIEWLHNIGERGEKLPLNLDLNFTITLPKNG